MLFEKRIEDILKPKPNQPQQVEQILRNAFSYYLGERKDKSLDYQPLIDYALPRLEALIKNAHTEGKLEGGIEELEGQQGTAWAVDKLYQGQGVIAVSTIIEVNKQRIKQLKAQRQSDGGKE